MNEHFSAALAGWTCVHGSRHDIFQRAKVRTSPGGGGQPEAHPFGPPIELSAIEMALRSDEPIWHIASQTRIRKSPIRAIVVRKARRYLRWPKFDVLLTVHSLMRRIMRLRQSYRGQRVTTVEAFLLGMMVAWTPSLVLLGVLLRGLPVTESAELRGQGASPEGQSTRGPRPSHRRPLQTEGGLAIGVGPVVTDGCSAGSQSQSSNTAW